LTGLKPVASAVGLRRHYVSFEIGTRGWICTPNLCILSAAVVYTGRSAPSTDTSLRDLLVGLHGH
jgi:hypothetical protein